MISLIRTQLLVSLSLNSLLRREKRLKTLAAAGVLTLCLAPSYGGYVLMLGKAFAFMRQHHLPLYGMAVTGTYALSQLMVLFVGLPMVYATLYQAKDLSILLPLPIRPGAILAAKLVATYVVELLICIAFFAPSVVFYAVYADAGAVAIGCAVLSMLLLPANPIAICSIFSILVANTPKIGRSKWFWYMALMVAMVSASLCFTTITAVAPRPEVVDLLQAKMAQLNRLGRLIPGSVFALRALASSGGTAVLNTLLSLAVTAAYLAALGALSHWLYFGPVLRGDSGTAKRSRRAEPMRVRSFLTSYMRKEFLSTVKDPPVILNSLGGYIAVPVVMASYAVMKVQTKGKVDVIGAIMNSLHRPELASHLAVVVVGLALALALLGSATSLFSASYSKDGRRLWLEKTLPVTPAAIFLGKLLMGMCVVTAFNLVTVLAVKLILPLSPWQLVYAFVLSEVAVAYNAAIGLAIDCRRPKLVWKDTVHAVKQNLNVMIAFLINLIALGVNGVLLWVCVRHQLPAATTYSAAMALNALMLAAAMTVGLRTSGALDRVQV